jgi:ABC-type lipoprotein release transport system permease subunit
MHCDWRGLSGNSMRALNILDTFFLVVFVLVLMLLLLMIFLRLPN